MCGRYTLAKTKKAVAEHYALPSCPDSFKPRYNIAPVQNNLVVIQTEKQNELRMMEWGLPWPNSPSSTRRVINGRAETLMQKSSFKHSFRHRRCLIPADGFIEWKNIHGTKYPHHTALKSAEIFSFAGLWSEFQSEENSFQAFCIITTEANASLQSIHHRMPAILKSDSYDRWLSSESNPLSLHSLLAPYPDELLSIRSISRKVNSAKNDTPECLQSEDLPPVQESLF
jgi:putative SOS response-associated peptidase YedK